MFGFLKGKITIALNAHEYRLGEAVSGTITLKLKKPRTGQLLVTLFAQDTLSQGMGKNRTTEVRKVFDFTQPLSTEQEFQNTELNFPFSITIPTDVHSGKLEGGLGVAMQAAQMLTQRSSRRKWFVTARFDTKGFDITKKMQINVV